MNAYELADELEKRELEAMEYGFDKELFDATNMLRQQAEKIKNLLDVIEAQKNYMKEQDKHIVDLAFKLVYAERGNEIAKELNDKQT